MDFRWVLSLKIRREKLAPHIVVEQPPYAASLEGFSLIGLTMTTIRYFKDGDTGLWPNVLDSVRYNLNNSRHLHHPIQRHA
jgi:hypothetical protein